MNKLLNWLEIVIVSIGNSIDNAMGIILYSVRLSTVYHQRPVHTS